MKFYEADFISKVSAWCFKSYSYSLHIIYKFQNRMINKYNFKTLEYM
jgi:hypothetical protein